MAYASSRTKPAPFGQRSEPYKSCVGMCQENLQKVQVHVPIRRSVYRDELRNLPFFVGLAPNSGERDLVANQSKSGR